MKNLHEESKVLLGLFIIATLVALIFVFWQFNSSSSQVDNDLAGFSVATVTDEEVVNKTTRSSQNGRDVYSGNSSGANSILYSTEDRDRFSRTVEKERGFSVVSASRVIDGKLTLKINSIIESGEGKIAIIQDNKVIEYLDFGANVTREYNVTGESLFLVKTICDNAKINIIVERTISPYD